MVKVRISHIIIEVATLKTIYKKSQTITFCTITQAKEFFRAVVYSTRKDNDKIEIDKNSQYTVFIEKPLTDIYELYKIQLLEGDNNG